MSGILSIDIETYSDQDLKKTGVYKYTESDNFMILLFGYSYNYEPTKVIDCTKHAIPEKIINDISGSTTKTAWNAQFERICLSKHILNKTGVYLDPESWDCTQFKAANMGYSLRLDTTAKILGLKEQKIKTNLISWFSKPDSKGVRRLPADHPEKWADYIRYCAQDVEVEMRIRKHIGDIKVERRLYAIDQRINDRGMKIDSKLVDNAIILDDKLKAETVITLKKLTGLENPNSDAQFKTWLKAEGFEMKSIAKDKVSEALETDIPDIIREGLLIRAKIKNAAVKKYHAIRRARCVDDRVRGLLQTYGASKTGRAAGRIVQIQNLYRNKSDNLDEIREYTKAGFDPRQKWGDSVLSELIRTAFIGNFAVVDFSAIEARVLAFLAGEQWKIDVFAGHGKIYEATAAKMFNVPIEKITKDSNERMRGKVAELACGYQGSIGALRRMKAEGSDEELKQLVNQWRAANKNIVRFWYKLQDILMLVIRTYAIIDYKHLRFYRTKTHLHIRLPSGRKLSYFRPFLTLGDYGEKVCYWGTDEGRWKVVDLYGGKLTENITQAVARDCLVTSLHRLAHLPVVGHVHDEILIDCEFENLNNKNIYAEMVKAMEKPMPWLPKLHLTAEGFISSYYKK